MNVKKIIHATKMLFVRISWEDISVNVNQDMREMAENVRILMNALNKIFVILKLYVLIHPVHSLANVLMVGWETESRLV